MERHEPEAGSKRFGGYLRKVREGRRLSLDAVEEMSVGFPERLTKSHLSRIETGQALPTFPRLFALSRIYGVPVSSLAERFEIELQREMVPVEVAGKSDEELISEAKTLVKSGRYREALARYSVALERNEAVPADEVREKKIVDLRIHQINSLSHLRHHELAKAECEELLGHPRLSPEQRIFLLQLFATACFRLSRHTIAMMALEQAQRESESQSTPPKVKADMEVIRGNILLTLGRPREAVAAYDRALELYEQMPIPFDACRTRVNLGAALIEDGDLDRARRELESALSVAEAAGYDWFRALAPSHLAVLEFRSGDLVLAETHALRSNAVARAREYISVVFRNCFYLWKIAGARNDEAGVKANEKTLRTYLGRLEQPLLEAEEFRTVLTGGAA